MKILFLTATFFMLCIAGANAECGTGSGHTCRDVKITKVYPTDDYTFIVTDGTETALTNCVPVSSEYLKLMNTHSNHEKIYSLLLSAKLSDLAVDIRLRDTTGGTGDCEIFYAILE